MEKKSSGKKWEKIVRNFYRNGVWPQGHGRHVGPGIADAGHAGKDFGNAVPNLVQPASSWALQSDVENIDAIYTNVDHFRTKMSEIVNTYVGHVLVPISSPD